MKKKLNLLAGLLLALSSIAYAVDVKISQLPLGSAATSSGGDSFPYVAFSTNVTKRLTLWDIVNVPTLVSTYAPKANPVFTGTLTAPAIIVSGQTATTVPYLNGSKSLISSAVTPTELGYLSGVTGSLCGIAQSCTLTNKTISGASNTLTNIARASISAGSADHVVINGGGGLLSSEAQLAVSRGGTGLASGTAGGVLAYTASGTLASSLGGSTGQILRSAGTSAVPTWSTATYPASTTINQILYSSSANVVAGISSANTSALVTNSSGVPSMTSGGTANRVLRTDGTSVTFAQVAAGTDISGQVAIANGGTGAATKAAAFDALSPMTTIGDMIYGGASGTGTRLAAGTTGQVLTANTGAAPTWGSVSSAFTAATVQTFTASGTYTKPSGPAPLYVKITVIGGGGAGGNGGTASGGAGGGSGGSGGASIKTVAGASVGATETVTVGAAGGTSSFGTFASATGGSNGTNASVQVPGTGGASGVGSLGTLNIKGAPGIQGFLGVTGSFNGQGGTGGSSILGGGGLGGVGGTNGTAGGNYGGGGGGGGGHPATPGTGGAGAGGIVIVEEFYQ